VPAGGAAAPAQVAPIGVEGDALSALVNLGYRRGEAQAALSRVLERLGPRPALDAVIRDGLKELGR